MDNKIKNTLKKIHINFEDGNYDISTYIIDLTEGEVKLLLVELFLNYPESYVIKLILTNLYLLKKIDINDWKEIFNRISANTLSLVTVIILLKKHIGVDAFKLLEELDSNVSKKDEVLMYFEERPGVLKFMEQEIKLIKDKYKVDSKDVEQIKNNFPPQ